MAAQTVERAPTADVVCRAKPPQTESPDLKKSPELINKEAEIIGVSDHLASELPTLIELARSGKLRFPEEGLRVVDLDAGQINAALDQLQHSIDHIRTIIRVTK